MILVIGATGTVGSEVVRQLRAKGPDVRALVRSAEKAAAVEEAGATAVVGDVAQPESLGPALDGVERVFSSCRVGPIRSSWRPTSSTP